jgi:hypothetical protein
MRAVLILILPFTHFVEKICNAKIVNENPANSYHNFAVFRILSECHSDEKSGVCLEYPKVKSTYFEQGPSFFTLVKGWG